MKNPPPPKALASVSQDYEPMELEPIVFPLEDGVVLSFEEETEFLLMTPKGARDIASRLIRCAEMLEIGRA